jgi:CRP-like cAMP-binding protein
MEVTMATERSLIQQFECFSNLSVEQLDAIAEISNSVCYLKGHTLFQEGDTAQWLYLLIEGEVGVYYNDPETGEEWVDAVSSEEVLGCSSLMPPHVYSATEKCLSDVEVLEINLENLRELIQNDPQLGLMLQEHIIKTLNERILALRQRAFA